MNLTDLDVLHVGDVVEASHVAWPEGSFIRGALYTQGDGESLQLCGFALTYNNGTVRGRELWRRLTVISRAPRPLYVNHPRTEPVPGDVVRDAESSNDRHVWVKNVAGFSNEWLAIPGHVYVPTSQLPARLRLLVDGETGQVVP